MMICAVKRSWFIVSTLAFFVTAAAQAQTVALTCNGTMNTYEPIHTEGNVAAAATIVDLDRNIISTPVGTFRINKVDEKTISFSEQTSSHIIEGDIDRFTGRLKVVWMRIAEKNKQLAGKVAQASMFAELRCIPAQRLF